ncbi:MAG: histidine kinase [Flavobacteriaceae bacterium]|nr:histidine kinase [Flavobacteriaceae bacterium]
MKKIFLHNTFKNILFWIVMFLYLLSSYWFREDNKIYITTYIGFKVFLQFILSLIILNVYIPFLLHKKKKVLFIFVVLITIYIIQILYSLVRVYYFETFYPEVYKYRPPYVLVERMTSFVAYVSNITWVVFPSIILIAIKHYQEQKDIIALKEQKKTTELNLLKHQLNPHFLFNTLNNLYALALKKSDKTPEVIAKLSEILDYILYQCKDNYVPLEKEIELLENYIGLEKVRYGNRVEVIFEKDLHDNLKIAPLILLTFVENAFKHGISQELQKGSIHISISAKEDLIVFKLSNTKPPTSISLEENDKKSIGMSNIIKQLDLLYPNAYDLKINESNSNYNLRLELHEKV